MDSTVTSISELDELGAKIPFGDRANQTVLPSWAAAMLTKLREVHGPIFRAMLGYAATGEYEPPATPKQPRAPRKRRDEADTDEDQHEADDHEADE